MQAIILAAGESSRFYPYNKLGHKSLVTLGGKTLLGRTIEHLKKAKITNIIIIENINESASKSLHGVNTEGLNIRYIIQEKATGMGEAILSAAKYLENSFFVLSAYHFEIDLFASDMMDVQKEADDIVLLTRDATDVSGFGAIKKVNGKISILEKQESGPAEKVIGIYLLNKEFVRVLHEEKKDHYSFETALTSYSQNHTLVLVKTTKETLSLKYPWDLLTVKDAILETTKRKINKSAHVSEHAVVKGAVEVDEGAKIMDGAVIMGPAYIGKNAYVGTNSIVRGGVCIEEGAVVGAQMEIKNAILMKRATTHSGFIGDSVVGEGTKIAAGFNTANVRLDRKDVGVMVKGEKVNSHMRELGVIIGSGSGFGIKVGTMPGVIIGNNTLIGPGTTVMENVESDVTYYTEVKAVIKKKKAE